MSQVVKKIIHTPKVPPPPEAVGAYSQGVLVDKTLYISGCLGLELETDDFAVGGTGAQAKQALVNMGHILEAAGFSYSHVSKCTLLLADINDLPVVNSVYKEFFKTNRPARATYQVAALPRGARIEIEGVAVKNDVVEV